jgi:uridine kinase
MSEPLPVPPQLKAQLDKCKVVRDDKYYKSREKTPAEIKASKDKLPPPPSASK